MIEAPPPQLLPWPIDAFMLIASTIHTADTGKMKSINLGFCRHCQGRVLYDGYAWRQAWSLQDRRGRPIMFFCEGCASKHEVPNG